MILFLRSQLLHRMQRMATLGAGLLVAAVSFIMLTSAVNTSKLEVVETVAKSFRPAYDILVRPQGSFTAIERRRGLVKENYLSGIFGGITMREYRAVKSLKGVSVAAPIANIGYIAPFQFIVTKMNRFLSDAPFQLYRVRYSWSADNGASHYPDSDHYLYYTTKDPFTRRHGIVREVVAGKRYPVCQGYSQSQAKHSQSFSPFAVSVLSGIACYSAKSPEINPSYSDLGGLPKGTAGVVGTGYFPVLLSAIDPTQEQKLVGLDRAVVSGRPLQESDSFRTVRKPCACHVVPMMASTHSYIDERLRASIERLSLPPEVDLPRRLAAKTGTDRWVGSLGGKVVGHVNYAMQPIYERMMSQYQQPFGGSSDNTVNYDAYWTASSTNYRSLGPKTLGAETVHNPGSVFGSYYGAGWAPVENKDTAFHKLQQYRASSFGGESTALHVVGRFDPRKLPGFSPLSEVPLETYYPPKVEPADQPSKRALNGQPLLPSQNMAGYVSQPPLMLTTLSGAQAFRDENFFSPRPRGGLISVIRIRVAGVTGPGPRSQERIRRVAAEIHDRTGLAVDITAGSSPHPLLIRLPAGKFGRPQLLVKEGWVEKGVAVRFLDAVDKKSLALFGLVLIICAFFLANGSLAAVRARRAEIGTLMCIGWSRSKIFIGILGEMALVGVVAGTVGSLLALLILSLTHLQLPLWRVLLVIPLAVILAVIAGALPALRAASGRPLDAVRPAVTVGRQAWSARHLTSMAIANLLRLPGRTMLGCAGLFLGVGALVFLVAVNEAFQATILGNLLGNYLSIQVRTVDFLTAGLTIVLGAFSVADVLFLNSKERAAEFATLSTSGWTDAHLRKLVILEGLGMALVGALGGLGVGLGGAALIFGTPVGATLWLALGAAVVGVFVTMLACLLPLAGLASVRPTIVLAEE